MSEQPDATAAHVERITETTEYHYPAHEPRKGDPHYTAFDEARKRLARLGKLVCWIGNDDCDVAHPIELHHSLVEFALANIVDEVHFAALYPEFKIGSDADFLAWIESEGNLLPLCKRHHTGLLGIHTIHYPAWLVQRFMRTGVPKPEMKVEVAASPQAAPTPPSVTVAMAGVPPEAVAVTVAPPPVP